METPEDPDEHLALGRDLADVSPQAALGHLRRAEELAPDDPYVLVNAAMLFLKLDHLDDSRRLAERAAVLDRDEEWEATYELLRGLLAWLDGDLEAAERHHRRAAELEPAFDEQLASFLEDQAGRTRRASGTSTSRTPVYWSRRSGDGA